VASRRIRLLLTNDDGIYSEGLLSLARELKTDYDLVVIAPNEQKSGASHSITIHSSLMVEKLCISGLEGIPCFSVTGTPADCVKLGLSTLCGKVDLVVSGINHGNNLGADTFYSGTVGAAFEGCLMGVPSLALSKRVAGNYESYEPSIKWSKHALRFMCKEIENGARTCDLLNVNFPDLPDSEIKGARFTHLCSNVFEIESYYKISDCEYGIPKWGHPNSNFEDCDVNWLLEGYVTMTPLQIERCNCKELKRLQNMFDKELINGDG
jgi:5'-nucleotidase